MDRHHSSPFLCVPADVETLESRRLLSAAQVAQSQAMEAASHPALPTVAIAPAGDLVVALQQGNSGQTSVEAEHRHVKTQPEGGAYNVSAPMTQNNITPTATMDASRTFSIAGSGNSPASSTATILVQQSSASGIAQGSQQLVSELPATQSSPPVAMQSEETFVVANTQPTSSNTSNVAAQQPVQSTTNPTAQSTPLPVNPVPPQQVLLGTTTTNLPLPTNVNQLGYPNDLNGVLSDSAGLNSGDVDFYGQLINGIDPLLLMPVAGINPLYLLLWQQYQFEYALMGL